MAPSDVELDGFERTTFTHEGTARTVYRAGSGPGVIVIAEMPGITPEVVGFARRVLDLGCSVALPHLFGEPGRDPFRAGMRRPSPTSSPASSRPACPASSPCWPRAGRRR